MRIQKILMMVIVMSAGAGEIFAQLAFDSTFSEDGFYVANPHTGANERGLAADIERTSDGSYLVAGSAFGVGGRTVMTVQKFQPNGAVDTSFGGGDGVFSLELNDLGSGGNALALQPDGKILVSGYSFLNEPLRMNIRRETVVRLNPDGTLDSTFGTGGAFVQQLPVQNNLDNGTESFDVEIMPDGRIVSGGEFRIGSQNQDPCSDAGSRCSTLNIFGTTGILQVQGIFDLGGYPEAREGITDIEVQSNGQIVAAILGSFSVARFGSNGALDPSFASNGVSRNWDFFGRTANQVRNIELLPGGKILATGKTVDSNLANGLLTIRLNSDGSPDNSYGTGGQTPVLGTGTGRTISGSDTIVQPDGKILVNGNQGQLIRLNEDGSPDQGFGTNGVLAVPGLEVPIELIGEEQGKIAYAARTTLLNPGEGQVDEWFVGRLRSDGTKFDFDGDMRTDLSIFRPNAGEWWYLRSSDTDDRAYQFGSSSDILVPADFTADGKTDIAFWRPGSGEWFVLRSDNTGFYSFPFGAVGDIPTAGDFDGDGAADPAVFRPSEGTWFIQKSGGGIEIIPFGADGDKPVVDDYDGDNKADVAIYRPSVAQWWINQSRDGLIAYSFGNPGDITVQGDYTGDGQADVAVFRKSSGTWFVLNSDGSGYFAFPFGGNADVPVPADYDGDGTIDPAVFRPSTTNWFVNGSSSGIQISSFGQSGDTPLPSVYSTE